MNLFIIIDVIWAKEVSLVLPIFKQYKYAKDYPPIPRLHTPHPENFEIYLKMHINYNFSSIFLKKAFKTTPISKISNHSRVFDIGPIGSLNV